MHFYIIRTIYFEFFRFGLVKYSPTETSNFNRQNRNSQQLTILYFKISYFLFMQKYLQIRKSMFLYINIIQRNPFFEQFLLFRPSND
jgi:hypothetical protein